MDLNKTEEELFAGFSSNYRNEIKKAIAESVQVKFDNSAFDKFYSLYARTHQRQGIYYDSEKELRDLQRTRFGYQGDLFKKKQELIKPIEDRVNIAIRSTATRLSYKVVLDKSEGNTVMYSKSALDITEEVERELGVLK